MVEEVTTSTTPITLEFSKEHAGWMNDILQDYEAMIITAKNTINEMRKSWEELLGKSDAKDAKELAAKMETLKLDEGHVKVAELRYRELQDIIWKFLGVNPADVKTNIPEGVEGVDAEGTEQVHPTNETEEVVQSGQTD